MVIRRRSLSQKKIRQSGLRTKPFGYPVQYFGRILVFNFHIYPFPRVKVAVTGKVDEFTLQNRKVGSAIPVRRHRLSQFMLVTGSLAIMLLLQYPTAGFTNAAQLTPSTHVSSSFLARFSASLVLSALLCSTSVHPVHLPAITKL